MRSSRRRSSTPWPVVAVVPRTALGLIHSSTRRRIDRDLERLVFRSHRRRRPPMMRMLPSTACSIKGRLNGLILGGNFPIYLFLQPSSFVFPPSFSPAIASFPCGHYILLHWTFLHPFLIISTMLAISLLQFFPLSLCLFQMVLISGFFLKSFISFILSTKTTLFLSPSSLSVFFFSYLPPFLYRYFS